MLQFDKLIDGCYFLIFQPSRQIQQTQVPKPSPTKLIDQQKKPAASGFDLLGDLGSDPFGSSTGSQSKFLYFSISEPSDALSSFGLVLTLS